MLLSSLFFLPLIYFTPSTSVVISSFTPLVSHIFSNSDPYEDATSDPTNILEPPYIIVDRSTGSVVPEHEVELSDYLFSAEQTASQANYPVSLEIPQYASSSQTRTIHVYWLMQIQESGNLHLQTLFLAVNIMDRFFSNPSISTSINPQNVDLYALVSIILSCKFHEVYCPVEILLRQCEDRYTHQQLLDAETKVFEAVGTVLSITPLDFLHRIAKVSENSTRVERLGEFLALSTLLDDVFGGVRPSLIAASAVFVARRILRYFEWSDELIVVSGNYRLDHIVPVVHMMIVAFKKHSALLTYSLPRRSMSQRAILASKVQIWIDKHCD